MDHDAMYEKPGFDPEGKGQWEEFFRSPLDTYDADDLAEQVTKTTINRFPGRKPHNNDADAFRHALWNFEMARELGPEATKRFGDAHEISRANDDGERLMDLYNNHVGRALAADPRNKDRPAEDVILEALRDGRLQTRPFKVFSLPSGVVRPRGLFLRGTYGSGGS